jgi:hypothetical protein
MSCVEKRPHGRPPEKVKKAFEWFRAHGPESTLVACMAGAGVSHNTAQKARRMLKNSGQLENHFSPFGPAPGAGLTDPAVHAAVPSTLRATPPRDAVPSPAPLPRLTARKYNELEGDVEESLRALPPVDAKAAAEELYRNASSDQVKLAALRVLGSLSGGAGTNDLGPGPPLTLDDRLHRGSLVLQACGRDNAPEVWRRAFNETIDATSPLPPPPVDDDIPDATLPPLEAPVAAAGAPIVSIEAA